MATVFQNDVVYEGNNYIEVQLQALGDTAQSALKVIDISTLAGPQSGSGDTPANWPVPSKLSLMEVTWDVQGFKYVRLQWDADTDDEIVTMSLQGSMSFWPVGGKHDPQSTGFTGDVMLVSAGPTAVTDTYNVKALFRKKQ